MPSELNEPSMLIIGGCGFIGSHLVRHFVQNPSWGSIAVASRSANTSKDQIRGASYHSVDLTDPSSIKALLLKLSPVAIIHAASPSPVTGKLSDYETVTIRGTEILLNVAKELSSVRVLVYVSSSTLARGREHVDLGEEFPLANTDPGSSAYAMSKALADIMVLRANTVQPNDPSSSWKGHLLTSALRFPIVYGTHDLVAIPGCLSALQGGKTNFQLGDGKNLWSFCSIENVCAAHDLLLQALLNQDLRPRHDVEKVSGEAFNIHDGIPHFFWDFARTVWKFAGHKPDNRKLIVLPSWVALVIASILEWLYWIFTFGTKRPYNMGKQQVEYACFTHTYDIGKARRLLGFEPKDNFEKDLKEAVEWSLREDGWGEKLRKTKMRDTE